jgi:hypothetical protein
MSVIFKCQKSFKRQEIKTVMTLQNATEHILLNRKMGIYLMGNISSLFIFRI